MATHSWFGNAVVASTLLFAMALRIIDLPHDMQLYNPDWVLLCMAYWCLALPDRFGVVSAWMTGLLTDVLTGRLLGQHGLTYVLVAYACVRLHRQLRVFPLLQQSLLIALLAAASQLMVFWTQRGSGSDNFLLSDWYPSVTSAIVWPLVMRLLRGIRRYFNVF